MRSVEFSRPGAVVHLVMGGLFVLAAVGGLGAMAVAFLAGERFDLKTIGLALAGAAGAVALGYGFIHSARVPLLTAMRLMCE